MHDSDEKKAQATSEDATTQDNQSSEEAELSKSSSDGGEAEASSNGESAVEGASAEEEAPDASLVVEELMARLEEMRGVVDDAKDQVLRARAEAENVRKRSAREYENVRRYALESFARELLPALDNFDTAVKIAKEQEVSDSVIEGIELSVKALTDALNKNGIQEFDPQGEIFDPERHMAMTSIEHPDAEPGTVIEVFRKGYLIHDRLLREAEVIVAKEISSADESDE